jgi:hypothetical protein
MNSRGERMRKRMIFIVVIDPTRKLLQDGQGIRAGLDPTVVTLERSHEGLADAIAFGAADKRKAGHQSERRSWCQSA